jgi:hypothetical protein
VSFEQRGNASAALGRIEREPVDLGHEVERINIRE